MGRMRFGVHKSLEAEADALIKRSLAASTADKSDILTPSKEALRRKREVFVPSGVPDSSLRRGQYSRAMNPVQRHLNSSEGVSAPPRVPGANGASASALASFVEQHLDG